MNQNALYSKQYLIKKYGYSDAQASGIVGNLIQESSMNTGAINRGDGSDGSNSIGIAQWNGQRAKGLHSFAGERGSDVSNLDTQLDYIHHELNSSESAAGNRLRNADNVFDATAAMIGFERPQGWSAKNPTAGHGWDNRLSHAKGLMGSAGEGVEPQAIAMAQAQAKSPVGENLMTGLQPKIAEQPKAPVQPKSNNGILLQAYNKLTGSDVQMPGSILGSPTGDVMKGIGGIGDFAKTLMESDADINKQIAAGARSGGRSNTPVEITLLSSEVPKKKRRGGLGGIGGYLA